MSRLRMGVFGLAGCGGDRLVLADVLDDGLYVMDSLELAVFPMVSPEPDTGAPLDVALVEGAVATEADRDRLEGIRARSQRLVALGTCAAWGGIPGPSGSGRPLHDVVTVDLRITGCPVEPAELAAALSALVRGDVPAPPRRPVCAECRMAGHACVLARPEGFCLGPLTAAGCGARCPGLGTGCAGCRGPAVDANWASALALYEERGVPRADAARRMSMFSP